MNRGGFFILSSSDVYINSSNAQIPTHNASVMSNTVSVSVSLIKQKQSKENGVTRGVNSVKKTRKYPFIPQAGASTIRLDNPNSSNLNKDEINNGDDQLVREYVQYRGGPVLGWIPWTHSLSYDTLSKRAPGTGTRKGGMEGA